MILHRAGRIVKAGQARMQRSSWEILCGRRFKPGLAWLGAGSRVNQTRDRYLTRVLFRTPDSL
jgi:hypothetical protein